MSSNTKTPPNPPRLCHIVRSPDFVGYGFNLHTIKNRTGQFIGKVDSGSPAEKALLKERDRILEVNGVNIANENHKQVVTRIKQMANETDLLVVDDEGDQWYKDHNIVLTADLPEVVKGTSVVRRPSTGSSDSPHSEDGRSSPATVSDASGRQDLDKDAPTAATAGHSVVEEVEKSSSSSSSDDENEAKKEVGNNESLHSEADNKKSEPTAAAVSVTNDEDKEDLAEKKSLSSSVNGGQESRDDETVTNGEQSTASAAKTTDDSSDSESEHHKTDEKKVTKHDDYQSPKETISEVTADHSATKEPIQSPQSTNTITNGSKRTDSVSSASSQGSAKAPEAVVANKSPTSVSPSPPSSVGAPSPTPAPASAAKTYQNYDGINLNMSAAEMRAYLASKKKKDIRHSEIDLRKKYEIIQKL